MRELLETRMFRVSWGNQHAAAQKGKAVEGGIIHANEFAMEERIAQVLNEITDGNWEIKATLPLTASEFSTQLTPPSKTMPAMATSFAAPFSDGVVFLCQRSRSLDEESYGQIILERNERQERLQKERRESFLRDNPVTEKKKLIGSRSYQFRGRDFATRELAETAQSLAMESL